MGTLREGPTLSEREGSNVCVNVSVSVRRQIEVACLLASPHPCALTGKQQAYTNVRMPCMALGSVPVRG